MAEEQVQPKYHRRNKLERARDGRLAAHMYLIQHLTQEEITVVLNAREDVDYTVSRQTVGRDLIKLDKQWTERAVAIVDEEKAKALAEIDALQETYWQAWERELVPDGQETVFETETEDIDEEGHQHDKKGDWTHKKKTIKVKRRLGPQNGPGWALQGIQDCIEKRCKILGINAPDKMALTDPTGEHEYREARDDLLADIQRSLARIATTNGAAEISGEPQ